MRVVLSFLLLAAFIWIIETHMLPLTCAKTGRRFKTFSFLICLKTKEVTLVLALKTGWKKKKTVWKKNTMLL
jgi:hypothetical protein